MTSAIDPTKPTSTRPRLSHVRANFAAAKVEIEALQAAMAASSYRFIEITKNVTGTTPLLVTEFMLPADTYTEFSAVIGTTSLTDVATLQVRKMDGAVIKTLTNTGVPSGAVTTGFVLDSNTLVGFYLYGGTSSTQAFIFSLGII